jgi:hypothetical protein
VHLANVRDRHGCHGVGHAGTLYSYPAGVVLIFKMWPSMLDEPIWTSHPAGASTKDAKYGINEEAWISSDADMTIDRWRNPNTISRGATGVLVLGRGPHV